MSRDLYRFTIRSGTAWWRFYVCRTTPVLNATSGECEGDLAFCSQDQKLYVYGASGWQAVDQGGEGGGGSLTLTTAEANLSSLPRRSGTFDLTGLSGLTSGRPVLMQQASGPYTSKGTLADEAEMDQVSFVASVLDPSTIRAHWTSPTFIVGNFKVQYAVG